VPPLNVLLITTDQMRRDHMVCAGNPVIHTPNLDRIAARGVNLSRAYVNNPVCMPNRSTILTGRLPRNHGCWCNGVELPEDNPTLSGALNARGYQAALLGKAHFRPFCDRYDGRPGGMENGVAWESGVNSPDWCGPYYQFQYVQLCMSHAHTTLNRAHHAAWLRRHLPGAVEKQFDIEPSPIGSPLCGTARYPAGAHSSHWLGEIGSEHLSERARDGRPFFTWVSFPDPHHPFILPEPYASMYDPADVVMPAYGAEALADKPPAYRRAHQAPGLRLNELTEPQLREVIARTYGMVTFIDENIGKLLDALDHTGLAENTVVVFTSDHGDLMGDNGLLLKGPWLAEGLVNVPMLWRVPGGAAGVTRDGLFSSCDIAPTLLRLLGADVPDRMDGLAQPDLVAGGAGVRDAAFIEYRMNPVSCEDAADLRAVVTADRKLVHWPGEPFGELYDLAAEVPDRRNLYDDPGHAGERAELERRLLDHEIFCPRPATWPITGS